jgi:plastocyanin
VPNPIATRKLRIFLIPSLFILALALAVAACGGDDDDDGATPTATDTPPPAATDTPTPAASSFEIKMVPVIAFDTDELTIPADTDVTIVADNTETGIPHNFSVWESREVAESGGTAIGLTTLCNGPCVEELTVNVSAGEYFFRCDVHPLTMIGTLTAQ